MLTAPFASVSEMNCWGGNSFRQKFEKSGCLCIVIAHENEEAFTGRGELFKKNASKHTRHTQYALCYNVSNRPLIISRVLFENTLQEVPAIFAGTLCACVQSVLVCVCV